MKEIVKFVCDHCKREYKVKKNAARHESICWKDKSKKTCLTCAYYDGWDVDLDWDPAGFSYNRRHVVCDHEEYCDSTDETPNLNCEGWVDRDLFKKGELPCLVTNERNKLFQW